MIHGFDCSGFVRYVLLEAGLVIPDYIDISGNIKPIRHTNEFMDHYGVTVQHGLHQPGDLILFSRNGYLPTHIGIVSDNNNYIHSPGINGQRVRKDRIKRQKIRAKDGEGKAIYHTNPIGFKSPTIAIETGNYRYSQIPI